VIDARLDILRQVVEPYLNEHYSHKDRPTIETIAEFDGFLPIVYAEPVATSSSETSLGIDSNTMVHALRALLPGLEALIRSWLGSQDKKLEAGYVVDHHGWHAY
jgi:hypothetical protein